MRWLLVFLLLIAACAPVDPTAQEPSPSVPDTDVVAPTPAPAPEPEPTPAPVAEAREANPAVEKLSARAPQVKGYKFNLATLPKKSGADTYYVRDDKIKIELVDPLKLDGWGADFIYLDRTKRTAFAYCLELGDCTRKELKQQVSFTEWNPVLPVDWLDQVKYGEIGRKLQFNERPVTAVRWEDGGRHYEAYLDDFYGIPQRVAAATDAEMTNVVSGFEYQFFESNAVTPEMVTPPY